jgi:putative ABC transport system permease protein
MRGLADAEADSILTDSSAVVMFHEGRKIETHLRRTDGNYWRILDFEFVEGGPFTEADNQNANFVAVITDRLREQLYGPNASAIGKTLRVDGHNFRVVGVVRAVPITRLVSFSEIWAPTRTLKGTDYLRQTRGEFRGIVLARSKSDFPKLRAEFAERTSHFVFEPQYNRLEVGLDTTFETAARNLLGSDTPRQNRPLMLRLILLAVTLLFITLPTVNLVSINLSRIMERASEIGVRKAFGASSRTLIGQFVMENVLLTVIGGALAFGLATWVLQLISNLKFIPYAVFDINMRIFGYGMLLAAFFGIVSGVYPAWRMSRMHPVDALKGGAQ